MVLYDSARNGTNKSLCTTAENNVTVDFTTSYRKLNQIGAYPCIET